MASKVKPKKAQRKTTTTRTKKRREPTEEEMMAAWQAASTPGEGHRRLDPIVGTFKTRTSFTMAPGAPPQVSEGTSEHAWALGGRYVEQRYSGQAMGMPFEGLGYTGYDNAQKKYVGTWMDTFGTGFMHSFGTGRPSKDAMTFEAESIDCMGQRVQWECKLKIKDRNEHTYELWTKAPNGKRYRAMIVEYTRA
jgi:hypothetical protein